MIRAMKTIQQKSMEAEDVNGSNVIDYAGNDKQQLWVSERVKSESTVPVVVAVTQSSYWDSERLPYRI